MSRRNWSQLDTSSGGWTRGEDCEIICRGAAEEINPGRLKRETTRRWNEGFEGTRAVPQSGCRGECRTVTGLPPAQNKLAQCLLLTVHTITRYVLHCLTFLLHISLAHDVLPTAVTHEAVRRILVHVLLGKSFECKELKTLQWSSEELVPGWDSNRVHP